MKVGYVYCFLRSTWERNGAFLSIMRVIAGTNGMPSLCIGYVFLLISPAASSRVYTNLDCFTLNQMASHWIELTILGFAVFIVLLFSLWSLSNYISRKRRLSSQWRYTSIKDMENME